MEARWNEVSGRVVACCLRVHRELGPGLLESVYDDCLATEFSLEGLSFQRQAAVPILYKGRPVGTPLRLDFLVERALIVEVKAVEAIHPVHKAQVLSYLKLTGAPLARLVNFHVSLLTQGLYRFLAKESWVRLAADPQDQGGDERGGR